MSELVTLADEGGMSGQIGVLGLGNWGTALAHHLCKQGFSVTAWSADKDQVETLNRTRTNPKYLQQFPLHPNLTAVSEISLALEGSFVVIALPSSALKLIADALKARPKIPIIISGIKGLESESRLTPLQYLAAHLPQGSQTAVLTGPCFARDLIAELPAGMVAASESPTVASDIAKMFSSAALKVYTSPDPLGAELGGIIKNVIAIAAGVSDGLDLGDSARAGLITRGLAEMMRLALAMGADPRTLSGLSGLGDLIMTCNANLSRNRSVGLRMGRGEKLSDILATIGSVAEGVKIAPMVLDLALRYDIDAPITVGVTTLLLDQISPSQMARSLVTRPLKAELD